MQFPLHRGTSLPRSNDLHQLSANRELVSTDPRYPVHFYFVSSTIWIHNSAAVSRSDLQM
jgi:hypothetical protein